jgi:hypothetical protein
LELAVSHLRQLVAEQVGRATQAFAISSNPVEQEVQFLSLVQSIHLGLIVEQALQAFPSTKKALLQTEQVGVIGSIRISHERQLVMVLLQAIHWPDDATG